jgi:hypothetical protein
LRAGDIKQKTFRSKSYLQFIRSQPCIICGKKSEAHHSETGGMGIKASDLTAIPLCRFHHTQWHTIGRQTFLSRYDINITHLQLVCMMEYVWRWFPHIDDPKEIMLLAFRSFIESEDAFR